MTSPENPKSSHRAEEEPYHVYRGVEGSMSFRDENHNVYQLSVGEQTDVHVNFPDGSGAVFRNNPFGRGRKNEFNSSNLPPFVPPQIVEALKRFLNAKVERTGVPTQEVLDATRAVVSAVQSLANKDQA